MIFLFLYFGSSTVIDGMCLNRFYDNDVKRPDNYHLVYSTNHSSFENFSLLYEYFGVIPFTLQIYGIHDFCTEYTFFKEFNVSDASKCIQYRINTTDIPIQCRFGYTVRIYNEIGLGYEVVAAKENLTNTTLQHNDKVEYKYYRPFNVDFYVSSPYFEGLQYAFTHNVSIFNYTFNFFSVTLDLLPPHLRPHYACFSADLSHFYEIAYNTSINPDLITIGRDTIHLYEYDQFEVNFYIISTMSCNDIIKLRTVQSDRNFSCIQFTIDDIPKECQIDNYPDDTPQYQPPKKEISDFLYSVIFVGDCSNFDNVVGKCKNNTVDYKHCSFINNAFEAICTDISFNVVDFNNKISKLFIIEKSSSHFRFENVKHQLIVHIKATDYDNFEDYIKHYDSDIMNTHYVYIDGDLKDKISHLTIENGILVISNNDLNIDTLYLKNSSVSNLVYEKGLRTNNLILEDSYTNFIYDHMFDNLMVVLRNKTNRPQFQMKQESLPEFNYRDWFNDTYEKIQSIRTVYAHKLGAIFVSHYFDFNPGYNDYLYDTNLTLYDIDDELSRVENPNLLEDKSKYYVELTHSGNWSKVREYGTVYFNGYQDFLNISNKLHPNQKLVLVDPPVCTTYEWAQKLYQPINSTGKPLLTYIYISKSYNHASCESMVYDWKRCKYEGYCSKDDFEIARYVVDTMCATEEKIDEVLKNVKEDTDKLYIINEVDDVVINLTSLPRKTVVNIQSVISLQSTLLEEKSKKPSYSALVYQKINLYGRIRGKVSYLTISNSLLNIIDYKLNVQSLELLSSEVNTEYPIESDFLIVDFTSHIYLLSSLVGSMNVQQYGLIVPYDEYDGEENIKYRISYQMNQWNLYLKSEDDDEYKPVDNTYGYVPYSFANTVGLIIVSNEFDFNIPYADTTDIKNVNITILNLDEPDLDLIKWAPFEDRKYKINLTYSGEWKENQKANITMTAYHEYIDIVLVNDSSSHFNIKKEDIFNFTTHPPYVPTPTPDPNATPRETPSPSQIPTATPIPELIEILFEEEKDEVTIQELNDALDALYEKLEEENGNKIAVVNAKNISFDKQMGNDQFIKPKSDSTIDFVNGNMNLILPDEGKVTVKLNSNDDVQIQIKGDGEIEFKKDDNGNINIKNDAQINGSLKITVPSTVDSLSVDSLYISKTGTIECKSESGNNIPITINNLTTDAQTKTTLKSLVIKDTINLIQTAELDLNDVDLTDSHIYYTIKNFYDLQSVLTGEFNDPPKTFQINWDYDYYDYNSRPNLGSTYEITNGVFNMDNCKEWANRIEFNDFYIESFCELASASILQNRESLKIKISSSSPSSPKNKPFPVGGIIGIVVGVIVIIAVIIVVVILVIKKKKNYNNTSDSINENDSENA